MESKLNLKNVLGTITALCAIGIMIIKYHTKGDLDSYIMPFILLWFSVILFSLKPENKAVRVKFTKTQNNIILSVVSLALISGLVMFFLTL